MRSLDLRYDKTTVQSRRTSGSIRVTTLGNETAILSFEIYSVKAYLAKDLVSRRLSRLTRITMKKASIQFLKWNPLYESEKPFQIFGTLLEDSVDQRKSNLAWHEEQVEVQDCRKNAAEFGLDSHGFAIRRMPTFAELPDREAVIGEYIPAIRNMLQTELEDVGTVFLFDWRVCGRSPAVTPRVITEPLQHRQLTPALQIRESVNQVKAGSMINFSDQFQPLLPSNYAHMDTSPISVIRRIQESFPNEAARILRHRVRAVKYANASSSLSTRCM